jgi:hypothetical protein
MLPLPQWARSKYILHLRGRSYSHPSSCSCCLALRSWLSWRSAASSGTLRSSLASTSSRCQRRYGSTLRGRCSMR